MILGLGNRSDYSRERALQYTHSLKKITYIVILIPEQQNSLVVFTVGLLSLIQI